MTELLFLLARLDGERIIRTYRQWLQGDIPFATVIGNGRNLLTGNAHHYQFTGIGCSMNIKRYVALQHHIICIEIRQFQAAIVSGDSTINGLSQDTCTFCIRMNGIRQQVRIWIERRMEIDEFCPTHPSHHLDGFLYLIVPQLGARNESGMTMGYRRHASQDKSYLWIGRTQRVHQRKIIFHELVTIVRPVSGVCIVDAQVDDCDIALEGHRLPILLLLHIRTVPVVQQGGARLSEVAYQVFVTQHIL